VDERDKRDVGERIEPGGRPKAPGRLELLQRFINTYNHDFPSDWDRIGTAEKAQAWLREKRLIAPGDRITDAGAAGLRELREALRGLLTGRPRAAVSHRGGLRVAVDGEGRTTLEPTAGGADGAAAALLVILHEAQLTGTWARMKACRHCEYAFYDRSKNRSATWCAMAICGNRSKNRAYHRRRRAPTA
jgi:predicted RNA-binding Zn ribbon-like protein